MDVKMPVRIRDSGRFYHVTSTDTQSLSSNPLRLSPATLLATLLGLSLLPKHTFKRMRNHRRSYTSPLIDDSSLRRSSQLKRIPCT